jgi:hypothetical protein
MNILADSLAGRLARHQRTFEQGNYTGLMEALLPCCCHDLPLPKWVYEQVIKQAYDTFARGSRDKGKHGNWLVKLKALQVDRVRAGMVHAHLRPGARGKQVGRGFVSKLAAVYDYGAPSPKHGGARIVTRNDIFKFVSTQLAGTPARGSAGAIKESYEKVKREGGLQWDDPVAHELLIKSNKARAKAERAKRDKRIVEAEVREQERLSRGGEQGPN